MSDSAPQPDDAPLSEEEIATLPRAGQIALAARCALRVAPALRLAVDVWKSRGGDEEASKHLRAVDGAIWVAIGTIVSIDVAPKSDYGRVSNAAAFAADAARDAARDAYTYAADVSGAGSHAADAAADAAHAADVTYAVDAVARANAHAAEAAYATYFAAHAADATYADADAAATNARVASRKDFERLRDPTWDVTDHVNRSFFERPLWSPEPPSWWQEAVIVPWANALPSPCGRIAERYMGMLDGRMDFRSGFRDLDAWLREQGWLDDKTPSEQGGDIDIELPSVEAHAASTGEGPIASDGYEATIRRPEPAPPGVPSAMADEPPERDLLGRQPLIEALAAMFRSPQQATPFTVGLLGDWGAGKSSVLNLVEKRLDQPHPTAFDVVWFDAWEYEKTDNIAAGLAQEVTRKLLRGPWGWFRRCRLVVREAGPTLIAAYWVLFVLLALALRSDVRSAIAAALKIDSNGAAGSGVVTGLIAVLAVGFLLAQVEMLRKTSIANWFSGVLNLLDYRGEIGKIPILKRQIATLCALRLGPTTPTRASPFPPVRWLRRPLDWFQSWFRGGMGPWQREPHPQGRRLLVYVDNLDRCNHRCISEVFDAVRLLMDLEEVIVVIAIDHRIALQAIAENYEKLASQGRTADEIARDYLGKIVQLPIRLGPAPSLVPYIEQRLFPDAVERPTPPLSPERPESPVAPATTSAAEAEEDDNADVETNVGRDDAVESVVEGEPQPSVTEDPPAEQPAPPAPPPSPTLDRSLAEAEMQDTIEERRTFLELTRVFDVDNPRRLLRLRNSFRLLKLISAAMRVVEEREPESSPFSVRYWESTKLLQLLFWQDFVDQLPTKRRRFLERWLYDESLPLEEGRLPDRELHVVGNLTRAGFARDLLRMSTNSSLEHAVRMLILPFTEEATKQDGDAAGRTESESETRQRRREDRGSRRFVVARGRGTRARRPSPGDR